MRESLTRVVCASTGDGSTGSSESHRLTLHSLINKMRERCSSEVESFGTSRPIDTS